MIALLAALSLQAAPDATLDELNRAYDQSCFVRVYGQFDDLCSQMQDRIKAYKAEQRRKPKPKPSIAPPPAAAATPPPTPVVAHEPLAGAPPQPR